MEEDEAVAFERSFMKSMKEHCEKEMRLPKDVSARAVLENKLRLLVTMDELSGFFSSKEFTKQKREFVRHVDDFAVRYELNIEEIKEKIQPTIFRRIVRK